MTKIGIVGVGAHSRENHLPVLAHLVATGEDLNLAALCDVNADAARAAAEEFGFARVYDSYGALLAAEKLDALIAVTPASITPAVTRAAVASGIPLLMEKPLAATAAEASALVNELNASDAKVMVSMNRRFEPALMELRRWAKGRPLERLHAILARENRTEPGFLPHTGIHAVDAALSLTDQRVVGNAIRPVSDGWILDLQLSEGALATIEIRPTAGQNAERYEMTGPGWSGRAWAAQFDRGAWELEAPGEARQAGRIPKEMPLWERNGTLAETERFLAAVRGEDSFWPSPADVMRATTLLG